MESLKKSCGLLREPLRKGFDPASPGVERRKFVAVTDLFWPEPQIPQAFSAKWEILRIPLE
jgi:hypothetical protein